MYLMKNSFSAYNSRQRKGETVGNFGVCIHRYINTPKSKTY